MAKLLRKRKKKWFPIVAPKEFKKIEIGETLAFDEKELIGRGINVNLMNLMGDPKKQNMQISLKINKVDEGIAQTEATGFSLMGTYVKRLSRKDTRKIDLSHVFILKDNTKIILKPVVVTRAKTYNSVMTALRKKIHDYLEEYCKKNDFYEVLIAVANYQLQKDLRKVLNKVYPVTICQFRVVKKI